MTRNTPNFNRVLVTGASGFIGGYLCEAIQNAGYSIRAVYRRETVPEVLLRVKDRGAELIRCDLTDSGNLYSLVKGMDCVVHNAGVLKDYGPLAPVVKQNYDTTVSLLKAAQNSNCRAFIYISSVVVQGFGHHVNSTEEGPYYPLISPYQKTKKMAEDYVLSQNSVGLRTAAIRPGNVYGPSENLTFDNLFRYMRKGMVGYIDGGKYLTCPTYVGNLAEAVVACLETKESAGQAFIITDGVKITWYEFMEVIRKKMGIGKIWMKGGPKWLAYIGALVSHALYRLFPLKGMPMITLHRVQAASNNHHFSIEKAKRVLGYAPRLNWRESLEEAVDAYLSKSRKR